jgi:DNA repair photolyase
MTTFDDDLCRIIEPNVSTTTERFQVLQTMREAGIPTVVWMTPILPFINDTEENLNGILDYCIRSEVRAILNFWFGLTMREGNREYLYQMPTANSRRYKRVVYMNLRNCNVCP